MITINWKKLFFIYSYSYDQPDSQCIIDLLEYYIHVNQELVAKLGHTSQKLNELEIENQSLRPSQS